MGFVLVGVDGVDFGYAVSAAVAAEVCCREGEWFAALDAPVEIDPSEFTCRTDAAGGRRLDRPIVAVW